MGTYVRYALFRLLVALCWILPQRLLYWIAFRIADLNCYLLDPKGKRAVLANLRQVLPDATDDRIRHEARWVFRNFGKYLTEFFRFRRFDRAFFERRVASHGLEHVRNALAGGKGLIVVSAHLSNWELGAASLSTQHGFTVNVVAAMHRYGRINRLFLREREAMGISVLDMERGAARQAVRALRRNEIVGLLGDRDPTEQGVTVEFFGRPCRFPQGPARLAILTGAPLVVAFAHRRTNDSFSVVYLPPVPEPTEGDRDERVGAMTQGCARLSEDAIRMHPEEWAVFYPMWDGGLKPA